jgi:hypothetical protein
MLFSRFSVASAIFGLSALSSSMFQSGAIAVSQPVPPEIVQLVTEVDRAASKQELEQVLRFYADGFEHSDGLTKDTLKTSLRELWSRYSQLSYKTEVKNWEQKGNQYTVEAVTKIQGNQKEAKFKPFKLTAELISKQTYQQKDGKWQILRQDITQETSILTAGNQPPIVELRLPNVIGVGRQYSLDAIAETPDYNIIVGAIFTEPVSANGFFKDRSVDLEPLRSGGIYKIGQAPYKEGNFWVSAVIVREGGITITGKRLRVSKDEVGDQYKPLPDVGPVRSLIRPSIPRIPAS